MTRTLGLLLALFIALSVGWGTAQDNERIGSFTYVHQLDELTDEDKSFFYTVDDSTGSFSPASLGFLCVDPNRSGIYTELTVVIQADTFLYERDNRIPVRYRLDAQEASPEQIWYVESRAVRPVDFAADLALVKELLAVGATQFVIRIFPSSGGAKTYTFQLEGLARALDRLPCWSPD